MDIKPPRRSPEQKLLRNEKERLKRKNDPEYAERLNEISRKVWAAKTPAQREARRLSRAAWENENPVSIKAKNQRRRTKDWDLATKDVVELFEKHKKCVACGGSDKLEIDHILPVIRGGRSVMENFQVLCMPCNRSKGIKTMKEWKGRRGHPLPTSVALC